MHLRVKSVVGWCVLGSCMVSLTSVPSLAASKSDLRLVEAVRNQDNKAVRTLLAAHADVNAPEADGATALHWAAYWDDLGTVDRLIHAGAKVNAANELGVTPLALACTNRNAAIVKSLLTAGANPNASLSATGETALMTAARTGSVEAVNALLAQGADVNASERLHGQTTLMWAVAHKHPAVVDALIKHGADVNARSLGATTITKREYEANEVETRTGYTPLLFAAQQGDLDSARLLLAAGAHVNDASTDGSPLVVATHSNYADLAKLLLDHGANPNASDAGYTALHVAVLTGNVDMVKALLMHGANPNARITKGTRYASYSQSLVLTSSVVGGTAFWLAAKFTEPEIMRVLAANGADPLATASSETRTAGFGGVSNDGATPLMVAAGLGWSADDPLEDRRGRFMRRDDHVNERGTLESVKLAVELGADVNAVSAEGDTALHGAASKGFATVVEYLAQHGAKLDVKNNKGQTPLWLTAYRLGPGKFPPVLPAYHESAGKVLRQLGAKDDLAEAEAIPPTQQ